MVMKLNFKSGVLFGENLMGCEMGCTKVVMKKPVYLSQAVVYRSTNCSEYFECGNCLQKNENFSIGNFGVKMGKMAKCLILNREAPSKNFWQRVFTKSKSRNITVKKRHYFFINFRVFHCVYITIQCNVTSLHNSSNSSLCIQLFYENTSYIEYEVLRNVYLRI